MLSSVTHLPGLTCPSFYAMDAPEPRGNSFLTEIFLSNTAKQQQQLYLVSKAVLVTWKLKVLSHPPPFCAV